MSPPHLLSYHHANPRRVKRCWFLLLLLCHLIASYAMIPAWVIHRLMLHKPIALPLILAIVLPIVSPQILFRSLTDMLFHSSRTWDDTDVALFLGYTLGFAIPFVIGLWRLLRRSPDPQSLSSLTSH